MSPAVSLAQNADETGDQQGDEQTIELLNLWQDLSTEQRAKVLRVATAEFLAD